MADNVTLPGTGIAVASDEIAGVAYQRVKLAVGADGVAVDAGYSGQPLRAQVPQSSTAAHTTVAASGTSVTILLANANRQRASVYNDSSAILYLRFEAAAASATAFKVKLFSEGYFAWEAGYPGEVRGIWSSAAGSARVVEES